MFYNITKLQLVVLGKIDSRMDNFSQMLHLYDYVCLEGEERELHITLNDILGTVSLL